MVDRAFFQKIIEFADEHQLLVVHDLAYADLVFDGYKAPSILEIPGARERAVEFFSLSKATAGRLAAGFCGDRDVSTRSPASRATLIRDLPAYSDRGYRRFARAPDCVRKL